MKGPRATTNDPERVDARFSALAMRLRMLADDCDAPCLAPQKTDQSDDAKANDFEIARRIRLYLAARRRRDAILGPGWFADPAWDILLDLLACRYEKRTITVSSACIAAAVPATTALRWIGALVEHGALLRVEDPADGRRVYLSLADTVAKALRTWVTDSL